MRKRVAFVLPAVFLVAVGIWLGVSQARSASGERKLIKKEIVAAVIPHFSIILPRIEEEWRNLAEETQPDLILLLGPDHYDVGDGPITVPKSTNILSYQPLAMEISSRLETDGVVRADDAAVANDHAFQLHAPYLRKYFSRTPVLVLAMRSDTTQEQVRRLANVLRPLLPASTAVVASVDFSHYKTKAEAEAYDAQTISALEKGDVDALFAFRSEHLDSRGSMALLSNVVCPERCEWKQEMHGNSGDLGLDPREPTTSFYFLRVIPAP